MLHFLDFEKPIAELEGKIEELRRMSEPDGIVEDAYQPPFVDRSPADGCLAQMRIEVEAHIASLPQARPIGEFPSASGA